MRIAILSVLLLCLGCKAQNEAVAIKKDMQADQDVLKPLLQDDNSGVEHQETLILKDAKSLKSFFSQINKTRKPGIAVPDIDFSKELVVVYCSGIRNDGAKPFLKKSRENETELVFEALHSMPEKKVSYISSPFTLYIMPLTEKAILFETDEK